MARTKKKRWSYSTGERGRNRVRAYEHASGVLMLEFSDRGKRKRISLRHRDRERAKRDADNAAAKLGRAEELKPKSLTLGELFEMYLEEVTPDKSPATEKFDRAAAKRLLRVLPPNTQPNRLHRSDWNRFVRARSSGEITGGAVGPRTVARDLKFLIAVLNWATAVRGSDGKFLLTQNPLKGEKLPREESPARPLIEHSRYQAMLKVAGEVDWRFEVALVLAHETGHRIGAIAALRWSDVNLEGGRIRWLKQNDKVGREHETEITDLTISALRNARANNPGVGTRWVFPAPGDESKPVSRHRLRSWWLQAEERAGLEHIARMGFHSLRRKFATELKDAPLRDVAELGGWKTVETLVECYQQPDRETQRAVLAGRRYIGESTQRIDTIGVEGTENEEPRSA